MRSGSQEVPPQNVEQFKKYLKSNHLKLTTERLAILDQVFAYDDHFRAEDLLVRMRQNGYQVSRATIYRTLPLLVKSGLLTEVIDAQKQSHFEHINALQQQHAHLICLRCGKLIEFKNVEIDGLQEAVCKAYGFKPIKYRNEILGYCFECQAEGV